MDSIFTSQSKISLVDKSFNLFLFIIIIIVFFIIIVPWNNLCIKKEGMSGGTVAQMFAQDSQDVYLKGNVDKIATSNFDLFWNQPTRQGMNVFQNRGQPLYSILLPDTSMNPTPKMLEVSNNYVDNIYNNEVHKKENELTFENPVLTLDNVLIKPETTRYKKTGDFENINNKTDYLTLNTTKNETMNIPIKTKSIKTTTPTMLKNDLPSSLDINLVANSNPYELSQVAKQATLTKKTADNLPKMVNWTPEDYLFQAYTNRTINKQNCLKSPASCGDGAGGSRLNDAFVQSTKAIPYVNLDNNYFYPDGYVGSYYNDNFNGLNIMKPYPYIPDANRV